MIGVTGKLLWARSSSKADPLLSHCGTAIFLPLLSKFRSLPFLTSFVAM